MMKMIICSASGVRCERKKGTAEMSDHSNKIASTSFLVKLLSMDTAKLACIYDAIKSSTLSEYELSKFSSFQIAHFPSANSVAQMIANVKKIL